MILEQIEGNVKVTFAGKSLVVGDTVDDYSKALSVIGTGKAVFRIDPNATFEIKGQEQEYIATPSPIPPSAPVVEAAPEAEVVPPAMETPGEDTEA
jgi:hypothetical protein